MPPSSRMHTGPALAVPPLAAQHPTTPFRAQELRATPLRATPARFRVLLGVGALLVVVGYDLVLTRSAGLPLAELILAPGFLLLACLVLLADLYPLVPSMRDVRAHVTFAWSAAMSLAAVLAFGPSASVLFLVSGLTSALSRRTGRWWQPALNMVVFGLIGLVLAALTELVSAVRPGEIDPLVPPGAWRLSMWGLLLAGVVVVAYALLMGLALTQLGISTWAKQRQRFGKSVRIWGTSLIAAPLLATLALDGPWALPSMAVVIISLNHLSAAMLRSTAMSRTDGLTGVANRLTLIQRLSERIAGLGRRPDGQSVTLMLIDLNRFKDVNDTYGHLVGDEVLAEVAQRLQAAARAADLVARYGGDEFAVVLSPGTTPTQAAALADAFTASLAGPVSTVDGVRVVVGGSIGIATSADPSTDVLGLLERADRDMYRAKRAAGAAPRGPVDAPTPLSPTAPDSSGGSSASGLAHTGLTSTGASATGPTPAGSWPTESSPTGSGPTVSTAGSSATGSSATMSGGIGVMATSEQSNPMTVPLRQTPAAFRWWWSGCMLALPLSFVALLQWAPGPDPAAIIRQPGAIILLGLILLADLYPMLPSMRRANPFDDFIMSTPLAIAALIVFGPQAAVVFIVAGAAMTLAARMVWWRVLLNAALWGLVGAAAAAVLSVITAPFAWDHPVPSAAMIPITLALAVVIETLNVVLVGTSVRLAGRTTWREYFADWRNQIAIGCIALTAPIPAVLAQEQPALLPLLALAMIAAQSGLIAVTSRTALAGTDPLTLLATRAALLAQLTDRLGRIRQSGDTVTLLLVDLDGFKKVNDDLGHLVGDRILVEVARRLQESTRSADVVARFGGDEFAIVLAGTVSERAVREVGQRINDAIRRPMHVHNRSMRVGASIGYAVARDRGTAATELIERADADLYRVKAARSVVR